MEVPFVDVRRQYVELKGEIDAAIARVLESGSYVNGKENLEFEKEFAAYCGAPHAVTSSNGTTALHLALLAMGLQPGDEVILPANTFIATAEAVAHAHGTPVLADVDEESFTLDADALRKAITPKTKVILPVHLYGQPAAMDEIQKIAEEHGIVIFEDCCQAHGARYKGERVPQNTGCFSFYPSKNLGAFGEGGMIVTHDVAVAEKARMLRSHGEKEKHHHSLLGHNFRLEELQAAILRVKLKKLDEWNAKRIAVARAYQKSMENPEIILPRESSESEHVYHLFVVRSKQRDELVAHLAARGIKTGIHYPVPIHLQPAFQYLGHSKGDFPVTEKLAGEILSLPMHPYLKDEEIKYVADSLNNWKE